MCEKEVDTDQSSRLCLTDSEAVTVARLAICLERLSGGPRDVEFAMSGSGVHLLQARPITTLHTWSDDELEHEFDSGVASQSDDWFTTANIGYNYKTISRAQSDYCSI